MTTQNTGTGRNRDQQDGIEPAIWNGVEYIDGAGAVMELEGTKTLDEEVVLANFGYGFNPGEGSNSEVLMLSTGSDTNRKYGIPQISAEYQRPWREFTGGTQNPMDANRFMEHNPRMTHVSDILVALHEAGILEVQDGKVIIRGDLHVQGQVLTNNVNPNPDMTPFEPYDG